MSAKPSGKNDPVAEAIARAPVAPEPMTEEELRAIAEARADIEAGRTHSQDEVTAIIAEMRRRQQGG